MNTAPLFSLTLNERASIRVNSWRATTIKFVNANSPNPEALKMRFQGVILNETRRIIGAR